MAIYYTLHLLVICIFYLISDLTLSRFYHYLIRSQSTKSENCSTNQMQYNNEKIKHGLFVGAQLTAICDYQSITRAFTFYLRSA